MNGLLTIAFGREYDKIAAHTMRHSRKFTDLPIHVFTNLHGQDRSSVWDEIQNVTFDLFRCAENKHNRWAKMQMNLWTPFDKTIYIDADAVTQKTGIECIFDMLDHADFVLNRNHHWEQGEKIPNIYAKAMTACGAKLPIDCYNGGFLAWRKEGETVDKLFDTWHDYWVRTGKGRDMPALACAVQKVKPLLYNPLPVFAPDKEDPRCIIQHNYNGTFFKNFDLPTFRESKPFDNDPSDFSFVEFKGEDDA